MLLAPILLLLLSGCGVYTLNPRGKSSYKTIAVEPFENKTPEFGITDQLTTIIIDAFIADGSMKVVSASNADVILTGTLLDYKREANVFTGTDQVQSYKVLMSFEIALEKGSDQSVIWKENIDEQGLYNANTETEQDGQKRAGDLLVQAILNKTTKSW
jgi:hypothetical protein